MRIICFFLMGLAAAYSLGEVKIRGVVQSGTTGNKGSADSVRLIYLRGGMTPVQTLENVQGTFELTHDGEFEAGRYLVQAVKGRAIYSVRVESPSKPVVVTVYENREQALIDGRVGSMAFLAYGSTMEIGVFFNLDNKSEPPVTLDRNGATFSFPLIPGYRDLEANTVRGSMPLRQTLNVEDGRASLSYPLTPGRTLLRVHAKYAYDASGENAYNVPIMESQEFMHVLTMPSGLKVEAPGMEFVRTDETTGYDLYQWTIPEHTGSISVKASGQPAASREAIAQQGEGGGGADQERARQQSATKFEKTSSSVSAYRWWIIGSILFLFGAASLLTLTFQRA